MTLRVFVLAGSEHIEMLAGFAVGVRQELEAQQWSGELAIVFVYLNALAKTLEKPEWRDRQFVYATHGAQIGRSHIETKVLAVDKGSFASRLLTATRAQQIQLGREIALAHVVQTEAAAISSG